MAPLVEAPGAADLERLVALFHLDLAAVGRTAEDGEVRATARTLLATALGQTPFLRVARREANAPADGVVVAQRWTSIKFCGPAYWIETLMVDPAVRRSGMGRALVQALIDHGEATGARGIDLESYRMSAPASFLYRSMGFRRLGRERYSIRLAPGEASSE